VCLRFEAGLRLFIHDRFNSIAVRIDDESREVVGAVFRMKAHAAVVLSAMGEGRFVEGRGGFLRRRPECNVESLTGRNDSLLAKADGKFIVRPGPSISDGRFFAARAAFLSKRPDITKRRESRVVEVCGSREISDREREMMQHELAHGIRVL
jgi:hypothetical protein